MRYIIIYQDPAGTERTKHVNGGERQLRDAINVLAAAGCRVCCWSAIKHTASMRRGRR